MQEKTLKFGSFINWPRTHTPINVYTLYLEFSHGRGLRAKLFSIPTDSGQHTGLTYQVHLRDQPGKHENLELRGPVNCGPTTRHIIWMHECEGGGVLVHRKSNKQSGQNATSTFCPKGQTFPATSLSELMVDRRLGKTLKAGPG